MADEHQKVSRDLQDTTGARDAFKSDLAQHREKLGACEEKILELEALLVSETAALLAAKTDLEGLRKENLDLSEALNASSTEVNAVKAEAEKLRSEVHDAEEVRVATEVKIAELEAAISAEKKAFEVTATDLKVEGDRLAEEKDKLGEKLGAAENLELEVSLTMKEEELKNITAETNDTLAGLQKQIDETLEALNSSEKNAGELTAKVLDVEKAKAEAESKAEKMESLHADEKMALQAAAADLEAKINALSDEHGRVSRNLQDITPARDAWPPILAYFLEDADKRNAEISTALGVSETEHTALKLRADELTAKLDEESQDITPARDALASDLALLREKFEASEMKIHELETFFENEKKAHADLTLQNATEISSAKTKISELEALLSDEKRKSETTAAEMNAKLEDADKRNAEYLLHWLTAKLDEVENAKAAVEAKIADMESLFAQEKKALQATAADLEAKVNALSDEHGMLEDADKRNAEISAALGVSETEHTALKLRGDELNVKLEEVENAKAAVEAKIADMESLFAQEKKPFKLPQLIWRPRAHRVKVKADELTAKLDEVENAKAAVEAKIADMESLFAQEKKALQATAADLEAKVNALSDEHGMVSRSLQDITPARDALASDLALLREKFEASEEKIHELEDILKNEKKAHADLTMQNATEISSAKSKISELEALLSEERMKHETTVAEMNAKLADVDKRNAEISAALVVSDTEHTALNAKLEEVKAVTESKMAEIGSNLPEEKKPQGTAVDLEGIVSPPLDHHDRVSRGLKKEDITPTSDSLVLDLGQVSDKLRASEEKVRELESLLYRERENSSESISQNTSELSAARNRMSELEALLAEEKVNSEKTAAELKEKLADLQKQKDEIMRVHDASGKAGESTKTHVDELSMKETSSKEAKAGDTRIAEIESHLAKHVVEATDMSERLKLSEDNVKSLTEEIKRLEDRIAELLQKCSGLEADAAVGRDASDRLKVSEENSKAQADEINRLEIHIAELLEKCSGLEADVAAAKEVAVTEKAALEKAVEDATQRDATLSKRLDDSLVTVDRLEKELEASSAESAGLLATLESERMKHAVSCSDLDAKLKDSSIAAELLNEKLRQETQALEEGRTRHAAQQADLETRLKEALDAHGLLKEKLALAESSTRSLEEVRAGHAAEAADLSNRLKDSEEQNKKQADEIKHLEVRTAELTIKCSTLEDEIAAARKSLEEVRASHTAEAADLAKRLQNSEKLKKTQSDEINGLQSRAAELFGKCSALENEVASAKKSLVLEKEAFVKALNEAKKSAPDSHSRSMPASDRSLDTDVEEAVSTSKAKEPVVSVTTLRKAIEERDAARKEVDSLDRLLSSYASASSKPIPNYEDVSEQFAELREEVEDLKEQRNALMDQVAMLRENLDSASQALAKVAGIQLHDKTIRFSSTPSVDIDIVRPIVADAARQHIAKMEEALDEAEMHIEELTARNEEMETMLLAVEEGLSEQQRQKEMERSQCDEGARPDFNGLEEIIQAQAAEVNRLTQEVERLQILLLAGGNLEQEKSRRHLNSIPEEDIEQPSSTRSLHRLSQASTSSTELSSQAAPLAGNLRRRNPRGVPRRAESAPMESGSNGVDFETDDEDMTSDYFLPSVFFNDLVRPGEIPAETTVRQPQRVLLTMRRISTATYKEYVEKLRNHITGLEAEIAQLNGRLVKMQRREDELRVEVGRGRMDVNEALRRLTESERERERVEIRVREIRRRKKRMPWDCCTRGGADEKD
ncbi:hypothetical protein BC829DRAFT_417188 [Chytridium lagenaria]|nr:hypothetical protein BC829DRAFT_417188 [Chytridium lagenaria]